MSQKYARCAVEVNTENSRFTVLSSRSKVRAARAARLFFFIQPRKFFVYGVAVDDTEAPLRIGSLRFDEGNVNDNTTNQWFDWLNEEKSSCCTCSTLFGEMFWRKLSNKDVNFSYLRFRPQRKLAAVILSFFASKWKPFVPSKRKCTPPILSNVIKKE